MNGLVASLGICALFVLYTLSDSPDRDCLLFGAVIIAISNAADRISEKILRK
jgi:hypothetical protein